MKTKIILLTCLLLVPFSTQAEFVGPNSYEPTALYLYESCKIVERNINLGVGIPTRANEAYRSGVCIGKIRSVIEMMIADEQTCMANEDAYSNVIRAFVETFELLHSQISEEQRAAFGDYQTDTLVARSLLAAHYGCEHPKAPAPGTKIGLHR